MATSNLSGVHILTPKQYETQLLSFLKDVEGSKPKIYADSVGVPTVGVGYALTTKSGNAVNWKSSFNSAGITRTTEQDTALDTLLSNIKNKIENISDVKKRKTEVKIDRTDRTKAADHTRVPE